MKRAIFFALSLLSLTGCFEPEFTGRWNGHCLEVTDENGTEYCFGTVQQAATAMGTDYAVARTIFINAQERYTKEVAKETARKDAQR